MYFLLAVPLTAVEEVLDLSVREVKMVGVSVLTWGQCLLRKGS